MVEGHLLRVQSFVLPPEVVVVLKPEALWIHGARVPLSVERDWTRALAEGRKKREKRFGDPLASARRIQLRGISFFGPDTSQSPTGIALSGGQCWPLNRRFINADDKR